MTPRGSDGPDRGKREDPERSVGLVLVLSGGASLGTYVAGAVTEILQALERSPRTAARLRVITGSSAGALTAGRAARALVINPSVLPWLERAWVDALDARVLLDADRPDRSALLDAREVDTLTRALITADPAADDRRSRAAGDPLRVGFSLSNLYGIPYELRYGFLNAPERRYGCRVHRDWIEFALGRDTGPSDPVWERVRQAGLASASVPFAFPPRALSRPRTEYPGAGLPAGDGDVRMWYVDGGLFSNEPVGLARRLVERFPDHRVAQWRYILVDPYMEDGGESRTLPVAPPGSPAETAHLVVRALLGHAAASDWREAHKINARLEILEALAARLPEIGDRIREPEAVGVGRAIGELAERVAEMKVAVRREPWTGPGDPVVDYLDENVRRIQADTRYRAAFEGVGSRPGRTRVAKLIFLLEAVGGLRAKDVLPLYLVAPPSGATLAGDFLGNFGGFLDREWRAADFRAGRRDARRLLEERFSDLVPYEPDAPDAYRVPERDPSFADAPVAVRDHLERFVQHEADRVLAGLDPGLLGSLTRPLWEPVVRRWAGRRVLRALGRAD